MDELDRLYRRLVHNVRAGFPELLARAFEVSQLYQQIVPYRTNRRELGFDSNDEYDLALMQLLAGLRGYVTGDAELQKAMRHQLASSNPDLSAFRVYATSAVALSPEALRALEQQPQSRSEVGERSGGGGSSATRASPSELAVMAARATEAVEVTTVAPLVAPPQPTVVNNPASNPAPPTHRSLFASDQSMTAPRSSPSRANAGESCRYCSGSLPEGRRVTFCPGCGHNLTVQHCPACASELEVGWKFCITCGREVG